MTDPVRVVLAEDNTLLREGLIGVLERFDFAVPAAVGDAERLLAVVEEHTPDLVLTDVRMPPTFRDEGLHAALELRRRHPVLPVVVLSQYVEHLHAGELIAESERGIGYLLKDRITDVRALVQSLRTVLAGGTVIDPEVVRQLLARRNDPVDRLSARERQTLASMAEGRSNRAIAAELVVSEATVAKHIRSLLDKLDLPPSTDDHRRVRAVLTYLQRPDPPTPGGAHRA